MTFQCSVRCHFWKFRRYFMVVVAVLILNLLNSVKWQWSKSISRRSFEYIDYHTLNSQLKKSIQSCIFNRHIFSRFDEFVERFRSTFAAEKSCDFFESVSSVIHRKMNYIIATHNYCCNWTCARHEASETISLFATLLIWCVVFCSGWRFSEGFLGNLEFGSVAIHWTVLIYLYLLVLYVCVMEWCSVKCHA